MFFAPAPLLITYLRTIDINQVQTTDFLPPELTRF